MLGVVRCCICVPDTFCLFFRKLQPRTGAVASLTLRPQAKHILMVCERLVKAEEGREAGAIPNTVKGVRLSLIHI